jgi:hypothetical protein
MYLIGCSVGAVELPGPEKKKMGKCLLMAEGMGHGYVHF